MDEHVETAILAYSLKHPTHRAGDRRERRRVVTGRVVITGIGIVSCLGLGVDAVGQALRAGKSGITLDPERVALGFRSPLTGMITRFDPQAYLTKKQRKTITSA